MLGEPSPLESESSCKCQRYTKKVIEVFAWSLKPNRKSAILGSWLILRIQVYLLPQSVHKTKGEFVPLIFLTCVFLKTFFIFMSILSLFCPSL